jgi:hypothetical protein
MCQDSNREDSEVRRKPLAPTVTVVSGLAALASLGASLLSGVDAVTCLVRGAVAYFVGRVLAQAWCSLVPAVRPEESAVPSLVEEEAEAAHEERAAA